MIKIPDWFRGRSSGTDAAILRRLDLILQKQGTIMTAIDDLKAAVAALSTAVDTLTSNVADASTEIQSEIADLKAALASGDTAAINEAVTNLASISSRLAAANQAIVDQTAALRADNLAPGPTP